MAVTRHPPCLTLYRFVVLAAMGGYGAVYLGWAIRTSDNAELVTKAKDLHPKVRSYVF